jgi:hypothetical protein
MASDTYKTLIAERKAGGGKTVAEIKPSKAKPRAEKSDGMNDPIPF